MVTSMDIHNRGFMMKRPHSTHGTPRRARACDALVSSAAPASGGGHLHLGWTADERPVWQAGASYLEGRALRCDERRGREARLRAALEATGRTRTLRVASTGRRVTVQMRIKADDEHAALADATTIVDDAATRSASGLLGDVAAIQVHAPASIPVR